MITKVEASNLKGYSFSYKLEPLTIIAGPNFSGKTAVLEAIRLALLGYIPEVGKRDSATMELASERSLSVSLSYSDRPEPTVRTWNEGKPSVSGERSEWKDLPLLHAEHYFSLTDRERTQYVFERVKLPGFTIEEILARLQNEPFGTDVTAQHEKARSEFIALLRRLVPADQDIQTWLASCVRSCKENYTKWNGRAKDTQGATRILTELKNREQSGAVPVEHIQKMITTGRNVIDELLQRRGSILRGREEREIAAAWVRKLQGWLDEDRRDWDHEISKREEQIAKLKKSKPAKNLADLEKRQLALSEEMAVARKQGEEIAQVLTELAEHDACPYCKSKARGWQTKVQEELVMQQVILGNSLFPLGEELVGVETSLEKERATQARYEADQEKASRLTLEVKKMRESRTMEKNHRARWTEERDGYAEKLKQSQTEPLEDVDAELQKAQQAMREWETKLSEAQRLAQDLKRAAESELAHRHAQASLDVVKLFGRSIEETRRQMIEQVFGTLLKKANVICDGILPSPLAFHNGTVGRWRDGRFIPHRTFSGVEKSLTYVAIAMALAGGGPLLLDELGRMTEKIRRSVMDRIAIALREKLIAQAIVIIPTDEPTTVHPADWRVLLTQKA